MWPLDLRVQMAEHENVAVFAVPGMEGEGGYADFNWFRFKGENIAPDKVSEKTD